MITPTIPTVYVSLDDTLKAMKAELRREFPATTFRVRRSRGTGYGYVSVSWVDGPQMHEVNAITDMYEGSSFDGMQDMESSVHHLGADANGNPVRIKYGTRGISCVRELSHALLASGARKAIRLFLSASDPRALVWLSLEDAALVREAENAQIMGEYLNIWARRMVGAEQYAQQAATVSGERAV